MNFLKDLFLPKYPDLVEKQYSKPPRTPSADCKILQDYFGAIFRGRANFFTSISAKDACDDITKVIQSTIWTPTSSTPTRYFNQAHRGSLKTNLVHHQTKPNMLTLRHDITTTKRLMNK